MLKMLKKLIKLLNKKLTKSKKLKVIPNKLDMLQNLIKTPKKENKLIKLVEKSIDLNS